MAERRPLTQGLKGKHDASRAKDDQSVYGAENPPAAAEPAPQASTVAETQPHVSTVSVNLSPLGARVSFSTKMRPDIAHVVKIASLDRQLKRIEPNTVQVVDYRLPSPSVGPDGGRAL
jgi:hypothetical protein